MRNRTKRIASAIFLVTITILCSYQIVFDLVTLGLDDCVYKYSKDRPTYLCIDCSGGLGNNLFQYAFAYAMSKHLNRTMVCHDTLLRDVQKVFQVPNGALDNRGTNICRNVRRYVNVKNSGYDRDIAGVDFGTADVHFKGFYQSWKYWEEYKDDIKRRFTLKEDLRLNALRMLDNISNQFKLKNGSVVNRVGIHIRRGDYLKQNGHEFGYGVATRKYILKAMRYMVERLDGHVVFVVASNDISWAREVITDKNTVFLQDNLMELDFAIMSLCDHFIMSVGTFGWWIGWQIKGLVTYYIKPFHPGSELADTFTSDYRTTYFCKGWIGL